MMGSTGVRVTDSAIVPARAIVWTQRNQTTIDDFSDDLGDDLLNFDTVEQDEFDNYAATSLIENDDDNTHERALAFRKPGDVWALCEQGNRGSTRCSSRTIDGFQSTGDPRGGASRCSARNARKVAGPSQRGAWEPPPPTRKARAPARSGRVKARPRCGVLE